jgi:hypothetical protein
MHTELQLEILKGRNVGELLAKGRLNIKLNLKDTRNYCVDRICLYQ